ncbi:hypothetical protein CVS30_05925 [Arthrobacter psychrolactophilus]|uniref:Uncharacterized protein n=1 Tax=Arthrobacter psychrolactophilus TaxID=92442 RepID=A0A2V5IVN0_9MICC|nr:hypothetical protein [Arthrobacter psychrolactophilus]PYI39482.1 hypothetical protein CVS30_05925 [Arthrobacter psychrolactophilus]
MGLIPNPFTFTGQRADPAPDATAMGVTCPLPEVKIRGEKLMNLGQIQQFLDTAKTVRFKDSHVPRVENSFSGRMTALRVKS